MTEFVFQRQVQRLQETYGKQVYTTERIRLFWETLREFPDSVFMKWIDEKIMTSRTAPLGEDIRLLVKNYEKNQFKNDSLSIAERIKNLPADEWKKHSYACNKCRDDGALLAIDREIGTQWVFVCDCPKGESSHWADDKIFSGETIKIRRWRFVSDSEKQKYKVGD